MYNLQKSVSKWSFYEPIVLIEKKMEFWYKNRVVKETASISMKTIPRGQHVHLGHALQRKAGNLIGMDHMTCSMNLGIAFHGSVARIVVLGYVIFIY